MTLTLPPSFLSIFGAERIVLTGSAISFSLAMMLGAAMQPTASGGPRQEFRPFNWANRAVAAPAGIWGVDPLPQLEQSNRSGVAG